MLWYNEAVIQQIIVLRCKFKAQSVLTIYPRNFFLHCLNLFATLINFLSFSVEHLQAMAQLEGRSCFVPQGEFILWQKVGPGAMVQEHIFQTSILGWDINDNFDFIRELILVAVVKRRPIFGSLCLKNDKFLLQRWPKIVVKLVHRCQILELLV